MRDGCTMDGSREGEVISSDKNALFSLWFYLINLGHLEVGIYRDDQSRADAKKANRRNRADRVDKVNRADRADRVDRVDKDEVDIERLDGVDRADGVRVDAE